MARRTTNGPVTGDDISKDALRERIKHMSPQQRRKYGKTLIDNPKTSDYTKSEWMELWHSEKELFKVNNGNKSKNVNAKSGSKSIPAKGQLVRIVPVESTRRRSRKR